MKTPFYDKTIWVTGASSGIGEALAVLFAGSGARLVLSGRDEPALKRVAKRCCAVKPFLEPHIEAFDMVEHSLFPAVVERVLHRTDGIDILINNAGVGQRAPALSCEPDVVHKIMNVNFFGTVFLTQALLPSMIERGAGRVVVVSSVLSKFHLPGRSAYAASKHALQGYFNTLRAELYGSGVGVTIACPGWIATHISQNALTADGTAYSEATGVASNKMSADSCALHIANAIASGKNEALMGGIETLGGLARALFPKLYDWAVQKRMTEFVYKK
jgi:short-subunit dehydrogenase